MVQELTSFNSASTAVKADLLSDGKDEHAAKLAPTECCMLQEELEVLVCRYLFDVSARNGG